MTNSLLQMRKFVSPEYVFGPGASKLAGRYARNLSMKRVMVVTGPHLFEMGAIDGVLASLHEAQMETVVFTDVKPNPRDTEVMNGVEVFMSEGCDSIVSIGGGSPMDCAKGIGIVSRNKGMILDYEGVDMVPKPGPPLICIPTTSGSSADVSQFAIINDTGRKVKVAIVSKTVVPDAALIDPELTMTMDRDLTIHTGMDALTHAVEAYVSNASSPVTDLFALEAVRRIGKHLIRAAENPQDIVSRAQMSLASMYAGLAFSNAILGAVHAMAHSLGGLLDLPHGQCNAILLNYVVEHNYHSCPEKYQALGASLGAELSKGEAEDVLKHKVFEVFDNIKKQLDMNVSLAQLGVERNDLPGLTKMAIMDPCMVTNPCKLSREDVEEIYAKAL